MKNIEICIETTHAGSELVSDILWSYSDEGTSIFDKRDLTDFLTSSSNWDYVEESLYSAPDEVYVRGYIPMRSREKKLLAISEDLKALKENSNGFLDVGTLKISCREVEKDKWRKEWKKFFHTIKLGKIVIVPEWIKYKAEKGEETIKIDSNMAFGTGEHETTSMCVRLLQKYVTGGETVFDIGCGSGILGIAAVKCGAGFADLSDIDDVAVSSAIHNAANNGVSEKIFVHNSAVPSDTKSGEIVIANITADILLKLKDEIYDKTAKGGTLILSGIIDDRLDAVLSGFTALGYDNIEKQRENGWNALVFKKL